MLLTRVVCRAVFMPLKVLVVFSDSQDDSCYSPPLPPSMLFLKCALLLASMEPFPSFLIFPPTSLDDSSVFVVLFWFFFSTQSWKVRESQSPGPFFTNYSLFLCVFSFYGFQYIYILTAFKTMTIAWFLHLNSNTWLIDISKLNIAKTELVVSTSNPSSLSIPRFRQVPQLLKLSI